MEKCNISVYVGLFWLHNLFVSTHSKKKKNEFWLYISYNTTKYYEYVHEWTTNPYNSLGRWVGMCSRCTYYREQTWCYIIYILDLI